MHFSNINYILKVLYKFGHCLLLTVLTRIRGITYRAHPLGTGSLWVSCSAMVNLVPDTRPRISKLEARTKLLLCQMRDIVRVGGCLGPKQAHYHA